MRFRTLGVVAAVAVAMEGCDDTNDNARGADEESAEQANALIKNKKKRRSESTSSQESGSLSPDLYSVDPEPKGVAATGSLALMEASGLESAEEALIAIKEKKDLILTHTSPEKIFSDLKNLEREVAGNIIHLRQVLRHSAKSEDLINKVYMQYRSAALEVQFHGDSKSRAQLAKSKSARTVLEQLVRDRSDLLSDFPEKMDLMNAHFTKEFQLYAKRLPPLTSVEREAFKAELQKAGGANPMIDTLPQALQPSEVLEQRLAELKKTESMKTVLVSGVKERDRLVALDKSSTSVKLLNMSLRAAVGTSEALKLLGDRECKRIVQSVWPVESFRNFVQSEAALIRPTDVGSVRNFLEKVEKELIEVKSEADESELDKVLADVVRVNPTLAAAVRAEGTTFVNRWLSVSSGEEKNLPETLNQQFQQGLSETVAGSVQLDSVVVEPRSPNQEIEKGAFPTGESREAIRSLGEARKSLEAGCSEALKNIDAVNAAEKSARLGKIHFLLSQVKEREAAYQFVIRKLKDINRQVWKDLVWDEQPEGVKELLLKAGRAPVSIHALYYVLNNINVNVMVSPADPAAVKSIVGSLIRAKAEILQLMDLKKDSSLKPALAVALAQRGVTRNHFALTDQQLKSVAIEGKERRMYDAILEGLEVSVRTAAAIVKAKKVEEIDAHIAKLDGLVIQDSITKNPKCKKRIEKEWLKLAPLSRKLVISMDPSVVPPPVLMAGYVLAHAKVWTWRNDGEAMLKQLAAYEKTFTDKQVEVRTAMVAAVHSTELAQLLPKDSSDPLEKEIIGAVNKKKWFSNKPAIDLSNYKELLKCASERSVVLLVDPDVLVRERVEAYFGRLVSALQASGERRPELVQEYLDAIAAERKSLSDFVDRDDSVPPGEKDKQKQTLLESFSRVVSDVQASNPVVYKTLAMEGFRDFGKSIVPESGDDKIDRDIGSGGPAPAVNAAASATDLESILEKKSIETRMKVAKALSVIKRFSGDETAVEQKIHELGTKFKSDPVLMEAVKGRMLQDYKKAFEETFTGGFDNDPNTQQDVTDLLTRLKPHFEALRYNENVMDQVRHFVREQLKGKDDWLAALRQAQQEGVESDMLNALLPQMPTGFAEAMSRSLSNVSQSGMSLDSMVAFLRDSGAVLRSFAVSVEEDFLFDEYENALGQNKELKNLINDEVGEIENPGELVEIATWLDRLEQFPAADAVGAIKILKKYQQFVDDEVKKLTRNNSGVEMIDPVEQGQELLNDAPSATHDDTITLKDEMWKGELTENNRDMIDPVTKAQELVKAAPPATHDDTITLMDEILKGSELNKNSVKSDEEDASAEITQLAAELRDDSADSSVDIPKSSNLLYYNNPMMGSASSGPAPAIPPAVNAAAAAKDFESILAKQSTHTRTQVESALSEIKRFSGDETAPIGTDPIDTMVDRSQENIGELVKGGDQDTLEAAQVAKPVTQRWEMPEKVRQEFVADINNANAVWKAKCNSDNLYGVRALFGYDKYRNMAALGDFLVNVGLAMRKQLLKIKLIDREDAKAQLREKLEVHLPTNLREQLHAKGNTPEFTTGDQLLGIHPSTGRSVYWRVPVKCVSDQELMVDYVKKAEALLLLAENNLSHAPALVPELREKASEIARNADPANTVFGQDLKRLMELTMWDIVRRSTPVATAIGVGELKQLASTIAGQPPAMIVRKLARFIDDLFEEIQPHVFDKLKTELIAVLPEPVQARLARIHSLDEFKDKYSKLLGWLESHVGYFWKQFELSLDAVVQAPDSLLSTLGPFFDAAYNKPQIESSIAAKVSEKFQEHPALVVALEKAPIAAGYSELINKILGIVHQTADKKKLFPDRPSAPPSDPQPPYQGPRILK